MLLLQRYHKQTAEWKKKKNPKTTNHKALSHCIFISTFCIISHLNGYIFCICRQLLRLFMLSFSQLELFNLLKQKRRRQSSALLYKMCIEASQRGSSDIYSLSTSLETPVHLHIHAAIQPANHVAAAQCKK